MYKVANILMLLLIMIFIFIVFNHYSSNKNINIKKYNRLNIDEILKKKIIDLPTLSTDTDNVIEFNNSINNGINGEKKRSFWDLIKSK